MQAQRAYKGTGGRDKDYWRCSRVGGGCGEVSRSYEAVQTLANAYVEEMLSRVPNLDPLEAHRSDIELRIEDLEAKALRRVDEGRQTSLPTTASSDWSMS